MKKSELERIIKEEVQNILKEGNVFPMWEDDKINEGNTVKQFTFGYDIDNVMAVQEYLIARYKVASNQPSIVGKEDDKEPDCKLYFGYGDDSINAVDIYNSALLQDKELRELINSCEGEGTYEEGEDNELNESIKHFQKLAGIITEEYGVIKEAKSNDYYKKGMMSQNGVNEIGMVHDPRSAGFKDDADKWENGAFHIKYQMLRNRNITNATEMAKKYENESWETVKRELKLN